MSRRSDNRARGPRPIDGASSQDTHLRSRQKTRFLIAAGNRRSDPERATEVMSEDDVQRLSARHDASFGERVVEGHLVVELQKAPWNLVKRDADPFDADEALEQVEERVEARLYRRIRRGVRERDLVSCPGLDSWSPTGT